MFGCIYRKQLYQILKMQSLVKHSTKSIEQYRHNIKLLKYHLKREQKINQTLRYKQIKKHKKEVQGSRLSKIQNKLDATYSMIQTVTKLNARTKEMGLVLGDVFRMADATYEGEITKECFMRTMGKLKTDIGEAIVNEMFYAIDTDFNGNLSQDEYNEFLYAHGGCDNKEAIKFQKRAAEKLAAALKKKSIKIPDFLNKTTDPIAASQLFTKLKQLKLNVNQIIILLKMWDPSLSGSIRHEVYLKSMEKVKQKDEKQIQNQKFEKGVQQLCIILRDRKINPIVIFEESQADGKPGISEFELEEGLKKLLPEETSFQIRKWVNLINLNGDSEITRQQFISSLKSFYSLQQINKFSSEYQKLHPQLKKALDSQQIPAQKIINQLSIAIEDNGLTKTQVFHRIDINHNGLVDKEELVQGLKNMGIKVGLIAKVLTVFDRDASGEVALDEWLEILGEDVEMEDVVLSTSVTKKTEKSKIAKKEPSKVTKKQQREESPSPEPTKPVKPVKEEKKQSKIVKKQLPSSNIDKTAVIKKTQPSKDQDKNKTLKTSQKKKPVLRPGPKKPTFAQDNSMIYSKQHLQAHAEEPEEPAQIDFTPLETEIGQLYAQSKNQVLKTFKNIVKTKKGINQNDLNRCLDALSLKSQHGKETVKAMFQANVSSNGTLVYQEWLQDLVMKYGLQIKSEPEPVKEQIKKPSAPAKPSVKEIPKQVQEESQVPNDSKMQENYDEQFQNDSRAREQHVKRGQNKEEFQDMINNLVLKEQEHTQQGYKISNFIGSDSELSLLSSKYLPLAQKIKSQKKPYKDPSFPSNLSSLTNLPPSKSQIQNVSLLKWKHYSQIFKSPKLFDKGIQPNDICQGQLGDCYFLCSLAGMAQYSKLIQRVFEYIDVENGYFLIWMCIDGIWKIIEVDGFVPVKPDGKAAVFSRCRQGDQELWVILLEKAYAKAYGCYEHIIGGQPYEAIKDLTGAPGQSFSHKSKEIDSNILWQKLTKANQAQFLMTCGTDDSQKGDTKLDQHSESVTAEGIVIGHAYSILDLAVYKGQKLIQLRNPWGSMQWNGAWSDKSDKWTKQAKSALKYGQHQDDGVFWMPFDTFYLHYATTAINFIRPNYFYQSQSKKSIQNLVIKIPISNIKHGFIMVAQQDHRKKGAPSNTPYNVCHIIAGCYKKGKIIKKLEDQKYMYQREASIQLNADEMEKGSQFVVLVNMEKSTNINLCRYGESKFQYELDDGFDVMLQYIQAIASMEQSAKNVQTDQRNTFKSWLTSVGQYAFLVFKNITKKELTIDIDLKKPSNVEVRGPLSIKLQIQPNSTQSVKGKIIDMKNPFSFGPMSYSAS